MSHFTFRPVAQWPRPFTKARRTSRFDSTYPQTLELLQRELDAIQARNRVIQMSLAESDIRRDGMPRASARPSHPGVIVSFETAKGAFSMPCDTFDDWTQNLRGIALSLEALRKIDRYGVTQSGEQYRGWQALPDGSGFQCSRKVNWADAARFLSEHSGIHITELSFAEETLKDAFRRAARKLHPDVPGGSHELFVQLQQAIAILQEQAAKRKARQ